MSQTEDGSTDNLNFSDGKYYKMHINNFIIL